jgi:hypothetical protein
VVVARPAGALGCSWLGGNSPAPYREALGVRSALPRAGNRPIYGRGGIQLHALGCRGGRDVPNLDQRARPQEGSEGPAGKGGARPTANPEAPRGGPDPEGGFGARNAWGRSGPRLARSPEAKARAAQARRATSCRGAARRRAVEPFHSALVQTRLTLKF